MQQRVGIRPQQARFLAKLLDEVDAAQERYKLACRAVLVGAFPTGKAQVLGIGEDHVVLELEETEDAP